jgi:hypothetical protein
VTLVDHRTLLSALEEPGRVRTVPVDALPKATDAVLPAAKVTSPSEVHRSGIRMCARSGCFIAISESQSISQKITGVLLGRQELMKENLLFMQPFICIVHETPT